MEVKISNLPPATEVKGGEELPVVQDGATKKMKREDFLGQSDWNCFDEKSSDYIKNKPCYKYEKEIEYTRLTLDKPVNEAIFPGFFNHGKKLGLVEGVAYTVDIISAEKTDTLQLTAIDFSSELDGFSPGTVIGLMNEASYFQLFDGVAVKDLLAGTFIPADDALYGIDDLSVQSIVIHGISSVETKLQKLPKEYLNTEELNVPIRKVITISNDDLP